MSLESKIERLEKLAKSKDEPDIMRGLPEMVEKASRLLHEMAARNERRASLPLHELIAELRTELAERVKENAHRKAHPEQHQSAIDLLGNNWNLLSEHCEELVRKKLATLEAKLATLS